MWWAMAAGSLLVGVLQLLAYLRAERFWRLGTLIERARHAVREDERRAAGAEWLEVRVEGSRQSLGSSVETPNELSAAPALETDEVFLVDAAGRRLRIPAGKRMRVESLPGARRQLLEGITTATGVEQRYSFELDPHTTFRLLAIAPEREGTTAFRDAHAAALEPFEGVYLVGSGTDEAEPTPAAEPGCGGRRAAHVVLGICVAGTALLFVPYVGMVLWGLCLLIGGLYLVAHLVEGLDPPRLSNELPAVQTLVARLVESDR